MLDLQIISCRHKATRANQIIPTEIISGVHNILCIFCMKNKTKSYWSSSLVSMLLLLLLLSHHIICLLQCSSSWSQMSSNTFSFCSRHVQMKFHCFVLRRSCTFFPRWSKDNKSLIGTKLQSDVQRWRPQQQQQQQHCRLLSQQRK